MTTPTVLRTFGSMSDRPTREICHEAADRIEQLESDRDELLACLNLIYSWANNWDSEFMNDPEWEDTDYPRIQAAIDKVRKP